MSMFSAGAAVMPEIPGVRTLKRPKRYEPIRLWYHIKAETGIEKVSRWGHHISLTFASSQ